MAVLDSRVNTLRAMDAVIHGLELSKPVRQDWYSVCPQKADKEEYKDICRSKKFYYNAVRKFTKIITVYYVEQEIIYK